MKIKTILLFMLILCVAPIAFSQSTTPSFTQYPAKVENIRNVKVNLASHKSARMFRTNLRNAARQGVNFGGHYVLTTWGCGTDCADSAIIDARNGKVFFPVQLSANEFCELPTETKRIMYQPNSRLIILNGTGDLENGGPCGIYYLEWIETKFKLIKFVRLAP